MLISDSSRVERWSTWISNRSSKEKNILNDDTWIQYLLDHREWIRLRSEIVVIDDAIMNRYQYRIREFLTDRKGTDVTCAQAFRIVNRLGSERDFNRNLRIVYVPRSSDIVNLRNDYNTCQQQLKRIGVTF